MKLGCVVGDLPPNVFAQETNSNVELHLSVAFTASQERFGVGDSLEYRGGVGA